MTPSLTFLGSVTLAAEVVERDDILGEGEDDKLRLETRLCCADRDDR